MTLTERGRTSQRRRGAEAGDLPRYPGLQAGGGAAGRRAGRGHQEGHAVLQTASPKRPGPAALQALRLLQGEPAGALHPSRFNLLYVVHPGTQKMYSVV